MPRSRHPALPSWVDRLLRVESPRGDVVDWPRAEEWTEKGAVLTTAEPERYAPGQTVSITPMGPRGCPRPAGRWGPAGRICGVVQEVVASPLGAFVLVRWTA